MSKYSDMLHTEVSQEILSLDLSLQPIAIEAHEKIIKADHHGEISCINMTFFKAIKPVYKSRLRTKADSIRYLDKANIYTWLAYTLYDDALDEARIEVLSCANIFMRNAVSSQLQAGIESDFINNLFNRVDTANQVELSMRSTEEPALDTLKKLLHEKSIAHCLGQIWMTREVSLDLTHGFENYCAARQLNDDIFDWRDDLSSNHTTYATETIHLDSRNDHQLYNNLNSSERLNVAFWSTALESLCKDVLSLTENSIKTLNTVLVQDSKYINLFIRPIALAASLSIEKNHEEKNKLSRLH